VSNEAQVGVPSGETARVRLTAQAPAVLCRRFGDINFEFDRSFIIPEQAVDMLRSISGYAEQFSSRQILIVGHTDTSGPPNYNPRLSERRGMSAFAHLTGDVSVWNRMYNQENSSSQKWGNREARHMLRFLKDSTGAPYFAGSPDDTGPASTAAIRRFQHDNGLTQTGNARRRTHRAMFEKFVEALRAEQVGIAASRFIEPQSGQFWLGCGEQHLALQTADDVPEEINRRVEYLFFLQPPAPPFDCSRYRPEWAQACIQQQLITVRVRIHDEYDEPLKIEFRLDTPDGGTIRDVTDNNGLWSSQPDSMPPGRYVLTVDGHEVVLVN
jgi:peptidoglycan hydrolase-like protein with peptidoglycan-binding domain